MSLLEVAYQTVLRQAGPATLIAVSKTRSADEIEALYRLGQRDFGESYVQELATKAQELKKRGISDIRWHFIGHLQTNKVKALLPHVHMIHAVDSERLAQELAKRWRALNTSTFLPVFIEVNIDAEPSKSGVSPDDAPRLVHALKACDGIEVIGLMCIPAFDQPTHQTQQAFQALKKLAFQILGAQAKLSMGMSEDFEIAIREGATHIRVGTAIFGPRPQK